MKIKIKHINSAGPWHNISFEGSFGKNMDEALSDFGARVCRILLLHLGTTTTLKLGASADSIDVLEQQYLTKSALQAVIDRYANRKLSIDFKKIEVIGRNARGVKQVLKNMAEVEKFCTECLKGTVSVSRALTLNLPLLSRDTIRVSKLAPNLTLTGHPYSPILKFCYSTAALDRPNPWEFMKALEGKVSKVIT